MKLVFEVCTSNAQKSNPPKVPKPEPPSVKNAVKGRMENAQKKFKPALPTEAEFGALVSTSKGEYIRNKFAVEPEYTTKIDAEGNEVQVDNRAAVVAEIEDSLVDITAYRIRVHVCGHDEGGNAPCGAWETVREVGTLPEDDL